MNILRRLPLSRLLLLCGVVVAVGIGATALALAVGTGPTPPPKPLADAVHDALSAPRSTASALASSSPTTCSKAPTSPAAAAKRGKSARVRCSQELPDAFGSARTDRPAWNCSPNRATHRSSGTARPPSSTTRPRTRSTATRRQHSQETQRRSRLRRALDDGSGSSTGTAPRTPTVGEIEESLTDAGKHANISPATPTDVAGQAAYTVRVSPRENGGLFGGAELSWDATTGVPLRTAIYSVNSSAPVIELAATEISYGPVESSILDFTPRRTPRSRKSRSRRSTTRAPPGPTRQAKSRT